MRKYIAEQHQWALGEQGAIAAFRIEKAYRKATADCLGELRAKGIIN